MKRRSFLAGMAAFLAGTKAAIAGTVEPEVNRFIARRRNRSAMQICRRFAERYQLEVHALENRLAVLFTLTGPPGVQVRWSTGLSRIRVGTDLQGKPLFQAPSGYLNRQLRYQMLKALYEIERDHGWRGIPPGISVEHPSGGVAAIDVGGYEAVPATSIYHQTARWEWERVKDGLRVYNRDGWRLVVDGGLWPL